MSPTIDESRFQRLKSDIGKVAVVSPVDHEEESWRRRCGGGGGGGAETRFVCPTFISLAALLDGPGAAERFIVLSATGEFKS